MNSSALASGRSNGTTERRLVLAPRRDLAGIVRLDALLGRWRRQSLWCVPRLLGRLPGRCNGPDRATSGMGVMAGFEMSTTRTERLGFASSQCRTMRLHPPPSSEFRAAPGSARPHFGQRWAVRGLTCASWGYPTYSVPGKALPSGSFSTNTGNRPSLNCWCRAHLLPVCRSMYMSVQTTRMNRRLEPCLLISPPWPFPALSCSAGLATAFLDHGLHVVYCFVTRLPVVVLRSRMACLARALTRIAGPNMRCLLMASHHQARPALTSTAAPGLPPRIPQRLLPAWRATRCSSRVSVVAAALAGPTQGLTVCEVGRFSCTVRLLPERRGRSSWIGLPNRSNIA